MTVARRVFFHVGLPKTGTTYLQTVLWGNQDELRRQGVLLPGASAREHLWASMAVREDPKLARRSAAAQGAWERIVGEANAWPDTVLISHEFFAAASAEQAKRAMEDLAGAEVHVVVTARETVSLVTARWQEYVKNGSAASIDDYPVGETTTPENEWDWGTLALDDVLARWGESVPAEHVHLLTVPKPSEPRETLWRRFAGVLGLEADRFDTSDPEVNKSLGVVEVELLRRINGDLEGFTAAIDRGTWIRGYLAQEKLVPRGGQKFWPSPHRVAELRERGNRAVDAVAARGYDVHGDLDDLRTPDELPPRRHPDSVTDDEMLAAATATIAAMLTDVRSLTRSNRDLTRRTSRAEGAQRVLAARVAEPGTFRKGVKKVARRVRRVWPRS